jgi:hypothetical protein
VLDLADLCPGFQADLASQGFNQEMPDGDLLFGCHF